MHFTQPLQNSGIIVAVAKVPKAKAKILVVTIGKKKKAIPVRIIPLSKVPKPKD